MNSAGVRSRSPRHHHGSIDMDSDKINVVVRIRPRVVISTNVNTQSFMLDNSETELVICRTGERFTFDYIANQECMQVYNGVLIFTYSIRRGSLK